ncbi:MAG TPA: HDOD domain-containing protein [Methylophaga aminisulfidivorans]|uniref:HDOD domain-containing protein n=2 Tax=root TaxID=1 RepID=A0A7C1VMZ1_9GAMM|nr:HDOD domain-containing protein [Methylophaga aminisulfidivorans]
MAQDPASFEQLKSFTGLIHRQPMFSKQSMEVERYHLSFLNLNGELLDNDSEVPSFICDLPDIVTTLNHQPSALLSMPDSWQEALISSSGLTPYLSLESYHAPLHTQYQQQLASRPFQLNQTMDTKTILLDLARINIDELSEQQLQDWLMQHHMICAMNVNNAQLYHQCKNLSLTLLQGDFYTQPDPDEHQQISPATQTLMNILVMLQDPDIEADDLAQAINKDISLSYKLLKLINSAFFGLPKQVETTSQAVVMLGFKKIKIWASLLCLSDMDDKPNEVRIAAMTRARMCELLAKYYKGQSELFFTVGLFSALDALLDKPIEKIVNELPLSNEVKSALVSFDGTAGSALKDTLNYEHGDWLKVSDSPIPKQILSRLYLESIQWSKQLDSQLHH